MKTDVLGIQTGEKIYIYIKPSNVCAERADEDMCETSRHI